MAKRKKSKSSSSNFSYSVELTGLILILIGIIGIGQLGIIGLYIKEFSFFLAGDIWYIVLLALLLLGTYMLINRKLPRFFSSKLIGLYLLFFIILTLSHFQLLDKTSGVSDMLNVTFENYMSRVETLSNSTKILYSGDSSIVVGGGIIGALLISGLSSLFDRTGTIVVIAILSLFAFILVFNVTISDIFKKIRLFFKKMPKDEEVKHKEYKLDGDELVLDKEPIKEEEVPEEDKKIVIASIDELKNINQVKEEVPVENEKTNEEVIDTNEPTSGSYRLPDINKLLNPISKKKSTEANYLKSNIDTLERALNDFEIKGKVVDTHIGPAVTEYEITVPNGTKVSKVLNINKEIALAMAAKDVRIQAPIPGKNTIGIEIPNREIAAVGIHEVLENIKGEKKENKIIVTLGNDIMGKSMSSDLTKTPHLLVAGSTGSGKSVCINSIIASILVHYKPDEVKLVLVDPKKVELSNYNGVPHLLCPVVCDPKKASATLQKIVTEMERRYELFAEKQFKNIAGYNEWVAKENSKNPDNPIPRMPYIVVIIDELADLMMVASKEVQDSIMRITQMARAAGIHLIVATQRPSTDIITGVIKNNIPSRIAFAVSSSIDSRTILDAAGAEKLLGRGDMLYLPMGQSTPTRIQGCFISDEEIERLIEYVKKQADVKYNEEFSSDEIHSSSSGSSNSEGDDDPMYNEIVEFAIETGKISASLIQRRFRFGYNRAARVIDILESRGIIGPQNGSKPREVLVKMENKDGE